MVSRKFREPTSTTTSFQTWHSGHSLYLCQPSLAVSQSCLRQRWKRLRWVRKAAFTPNIPQHAARPKSQCYIAHRARGQICIWRKKL